jgi:hypothetical protein
MIYTTLNRIRACSPCGLKPDADGTRTGLCKLLHHLDKTTTDDEPLPLAVILESNGLVDALWCLRTVPEESSRWRRLAVSYARTVQHLMVDPRSLAALDVAERHADGTATRAELTAAWSEANRAANDADASAQAPAYAAVAAADPDAFEAAYDAAHEAGLALGQPPQHFPERWKRLSDMYLEACTAA